MGELVLQVAARTIQEGHIGEITAWVNGPWYLEKQLGLNHNSRPEVTYRPSEARNSTGRGILMKELSWLIFECNVKLDSEGTQAHTAYVNVLYANRHHIVTMLDIEERSLMLEGALWGCLVDLDTTVPDTEKAP